MYREIIVTTIGEYADAISDAMWETGVAGVEISDPRDVKEVLTSSTNWDYVDDNVIIDNDVVTIKGFIECDNIDIATENLKSIVLLSTGNKISVEVNDIVEQDWENSWKSFYSPVNAGKFLVVPEWIDSDNNENKIVVRINPATAFGTGAHESTQLCLMLLSEIDLKDKSVLDVGAGSGILGIAASLAGSKDVYMTDIDPEAVKACEENLELNGIRRGVTVACADLLNGLDVKANVITANLTADILGMLAKGIKSHIERGGILICSGIIDKRKEEVVDLYKSLGFTLRRAENIGEWWGLEFGFNG